jgi:hypothetical protein
MLGNSKFSDSMFFDGKIAFFNFLWYRCYLNYFLSFLPIDLIFSPKCLPCFSQQTVWITFLNLIHIFDRIRLKAQLKIF